MATRISEKLVRVGTQHVKRCASCGRKITPGHENDINGKFYGSECVQRILDRLNSQGKSE
jgi:hypothetical protein